MNPTVEDGVKWACVGRRGRPGCGLVMRLPQRKAAARWYCCAACRKRAGRRRGGLEPCWACDVKACGFRMAASGRVQVRCLE